MGEENPKCLFCFPLECGVMVLTCLVWLFTTVTSAEIIFGWIDASWSLHGVGVCAYFIMGCTFIYAWCAKTNEARQMAFFVWIACCVISARVWYLYTMLTGKYAESVCTEEYLEQINASGLIETITVEDCNYGVYQSQWADLLIGWVFDIYFATVIFRWSKNLDKDGYQAVE